MKLVNNLPGTTSWAAYLKMWALLENPPSQHDLR